MSVDYSLIPIMAIDAVYNIFEKNNSSIMTKEQDAATEIASMEERRNEFHQKVTELVSAVEGLTAKDIEFYLDSGEILRLLEISDTPKNLAAMTVYAVLIQAALFRDPNFERLLFDMFQEGFTLQQSPLAKDAIEDYLETTQGDTEEAEGMLLTDYFSEKLREINFVDVMVW